jgi:chromosome condensin MukBEF MukE localization factor
VFEYVLDVARSIGLQVNDVVLKRLIPEVSSNVDDESKQGEREKSGMQDTSRNGVVSTVGDGADSAKLTFSEVLTRVRVVSHLSIIGIMG